eukprot:scaffold226772_cov33-Attheya_sp.AAC.1
MSLGWALVGEWVGPTCALAVESVPWSWVTGLAGASVFVWVIVWEGMSVLVWEIEWLVGGWEEGRELYLCYCGNGYAPVGCTAGLETFICSFRERCWISHNQLTRFGSICSQLAKDCLPDDLRYCNNT